MTPLPRRGLYAITDNDLIPDTKLLNYVAAAITGGAVVVQYRDKRKNRDLRRDLAKRLLSLCREQKVPLIINDDVSLAEEIGADGVHLGQDDAALNDARQRLGEKAIIGISCYNNQERAITAERQGANYVAFGRFYSSQTKPNAVQAPIGLLAHAKSVLKTPIVAIGGITPDNGAPLIAAGADFTAVVGGIFLGGHPTSAAQRYTTLFNP